MGNVFESNRERVKLFLREDLLRLDLKPQSRELIQTVVKDFDNMSVFKITRNLDKAYKLEKEQAYGQVINGISIKIAKNITKKAKPNLFSDKAYKVDITESIDELSRIVNKYIDAYNEHNNRLF